jgi:RNA polymerase sigma-70 factor (ECF subfamily)
MKSVIEESDHDLLKHIANGSEEAFGKLFERYKNIIYSHAFHFTQSVFIAEEITQDVFLKCWLKKETLIEIEAVEAWLYTITKNLCFNHLKTKAREYKFKNALAQSEEPGEENIESYLAVKEQQDLLRKAIDHLSAKQKLIFTLNRDGGMKNAEIAEQLHLSPNTVKTHMVSALRTIRIFFKQHAEGVVQLFLLFQVLK